ncbi:protein of unknown function [Catalinimonas alkaloidigena]|uniref:DUF4136 domain-containing protein n=1 Tax=Catalinimonas alkaloidigena TaxID=1075417 RepID=A0A1G9EC58_9BACT|nr:DUF4136 domain-containing protein [Catalinimonas alkaloidigena]SDK73750.1 protein of unknown function [Catalinimonas alkaloidigena]
MKRYTYYIGAFALLLLFSCSPQLTVHSDYDKEAQFDSFSTYAWVDSAGMKQTSDNPTIDNSLNLKRIRQAIEREMNNLGYEMVSSDPDLLVNYQIAVNQKTDTRYMNNYGYWYWPTYQNAYAQDYDEAMIIVDLINATDKQLVWQGWAATDAATLQQDPEGTINEAVTDIFKKYEKVGQPQRVAYN